jgi:hypothetical protein
MGGQRTFGMASLNFADMQQMDDLDPGGMRATCPQG